jgi:hypothetical protein
MSDRRPSIGRSDLAAREYGGLAPSQGRGGSDLADVLERVLDKGVVVAGDIAVNLLDIELLTIKLRLLIASADKAREMGIDWWTHDPFLSTQARELSEGNGHGEADPEALRSRLERMESLLESMRKRELEPAGEAEPSRGPENDHEPG